MKKIITISAIILLLFACFISIEYFSKKLVLKKQIFDFKGIQISAPSTPEKVQEALGVTCGIGANYFQICNGSVTIAAEPATMNLVINQNGIVQRILLLPSPDAFETISQELIKKFGEPTETNRSTVRTRIGVEYFQVEHTWKSSDGNEVVYSKYTSSIDTSQLIFSSQEDREFLGKQKIDTSKDI